MHQTIERFTCDNCQRIVETPAQVRVTAGAPFRITDWPAGWRQMTISGSSGPEASAGSCTLVCSRCYDKLSNLLSSWRSE